VLVVDAHTLQAVNLLHFVDQVGRKLFNALDRKDVVRCRVTIEDVLALLDVIAFLNRQVLALRDQVFGWLHRVVFRHDADAALVLVVAAKLHTPGNLGDDGVILRTAGLEQLGHTRQTTGDVAGLGAFQRDTGQHVTGGDR
jgi:hypothetical protein